MATIAHQRMQEELVETVYRAALSPDAWFDVMALMRRAFPSSAQTFYFLERERRELRAVCLDGVERRWLPSFAGLYFAPDNPWMKVTERLHRPGVVRTNERLDAFLREEGALYGSAYYNEWMRPQGYRYTLGNTLLSRGGTVANVTLMRPPDMGTFSDDEVHRFERLSRHMTRVLELGMAFHASTASVAAAAWLQLPQPVALLGAGLRVVEANAAMEAMLRAGKVLVARQGRLSALHAATQARLAALVDEALSGTEATSPAGQWVALPDDAAGSTAQVVRFVHTVSPYLPPRRLAMLVLQRPADTRAVAAQTLQQRYRCTRSEIRLALLLAGGQTLQQAASSLNVGYESARVVLKRLFVKLDVHTQAQLVSKVLSVGAGEGPPPPRRA